jgi:hypothetical protein
LIEARDQVGAELRKGEWFVTPGGLKFWPALDTFRRLCESHDRAVEANDYAARFLRSAFVDNDEAHVKPEWIDDLLARLDVANV